MADFLSVKALYAKALLGGGVRRSLTEIDWDISGDCLSPVTTPIWGRRHRKVHVLGRLTQRQDDGSKLTVMPAELRQDRACYGEDGLTHLCVYLEARCRKCQHCLRLRGRQWAARCIEETKAASRTWFGTLTLNPTLRLRARWQAQQQAASRGLCYESLAEREQFKLQVEALNPLLTKWIKRVRKESGARLRYCLVSEPHKDGTPHFHVLIHEVSGQVTYRTLSRQWEIFGFTKFKLVAAEEVGKPGIYVAKYLSKSLCARVRASQAYGSAEGRSGNHRRTFSKHSENVNSGPPAGSAEECSHGESISEIPRRLSRFRRAIEGVFVNEYLSAEPFRFSEVEERPSRDGLPGELGASGRAPDVNAGAVPSGGIPHQRARVRCRLAGKAQWNGYELCRSGAVRFEPLGQYRHGRDDV